MKLDGHLDLICPGCGAHFVCARARKFVCVWPVRLVRHRGFVSAVLVGPVLNSRDVTRWPGGRGQAGGGVKGWGGRGIRGVFVDPAHCVLDSASIDIPTVQHRCLSNTRFGDADYAPGVGSGVGISGALPGDRGRL